METICEQPENRVGCQGVICPLASELRVYEQHVRQMEERVREHYNQMSRMGMLFRLMADSLEGLADVNAVNSLVTGTEPAYVTVGRFFCYIPIQSYSLV